MPAAAGEGRAGRPGTGAAGEGGLRPRVLAPPAETEKEEGAEGRREGSGSFEGRAGGGKKKCLEERERRQEATRSVTLFVCLFVCSLIADLGAARGVVR